jgi:hypothetical protein
LRGVVGEGSGSLKLDSRLSATVSVGISAADLAIAYGFNRIERTLPRTLTSGSQLPINKLSDALRLELVGAGYDEVGM